MSSLKEKATLNFYQWESRGRGYYHFDTTVEVEPPYVPFIPVNPSVEEYIDDGKVPSLLKKLTNIISSPKQVREENIDVAEILPVAVSIQSKLQCIGITFPQGTDISVQLMHEVLSLLSFSEGSFSFEILAQNGEITAQFTSSKYDSTRLESHLKAFFPYIIFQTKDALDINFDLDDSVAIADFGLDNEFMLPINSTDSLVIDPLTSIIATLGTLQDNETAIFQVIFKGVTAPWSKDMLYSISDGRGGSFFEGNPEFVTGTQDKIRSPLFGVVLRIGAQVQTEEDSRSIASDLARSITTISSSEYNRLIPLSNEGYEYDDHLRNIYNRTTNRIGFILNSQELAHFVHYPNKTVINERLGIGARKTKRQETASSEGIYIGTNHHHGQEYLVSLETESRLSHTHIIGSTGVGKSTLIANMMLADIECGRGCAIFDPHGDICDDILKRIPKHRKDDVIIIDPSDSEYLIGFNLLEAHTEAEKIVLSSDLVSAFKRHATAWGDNMTAVLQNAVNTILDSNRGGTLIELKRLLIEESFRNEYLTSVDDPSLHYYWQHEYPVVRKGIAPLLTRIDTFLRPKLVRYMLAQKSGVDTSQCLREDKIVLLKLSQGLIGEQNSYLLGSLFLAKFNQSALARQSEIREARSPYMLYLDEFQNFITPSIERILSGARKYALGITIAHQELGQIQESSLLNSILSNPKIRICFRLGDNDAKRLESGFSYFEQSDLQNLGRGEAIVRIGSSNNDFNLQTSPLSISKMDYSDNIIANVRSKYGTPRAEVEELLLSLLPKISIQQKKKEDIPIAKTILVEPVESISKEEIEEDKLLPSDLEKQKEAYLKETEKEEQEQAHRTIQNYIISVGQQRGFAVHLETETDSGGRIDVTLKKDTTEIAVEISVTNTIDYEVKNIQKCVKDGYQKVFMISESKVHLNNIKKRTKGSFQSVDFKKVKFGSPAQFLTYLNSFEKKPKEKVKRIRGYRVKANQVDLNDSDAKTRNNKIQDIILRSVKKKK